MPVLSLKPLPECYETLEFSTDIVRPPGNEYRTRRTDVRTNIGYAFRTTNERFAALEELLVANARVDWDIPAWHEKTRRLNLSAGQTVLPVSTEADYVAGGRAMIWKGCDEYEIASIDSVGVGSITLTGGLSAAYTDVAVMPLHTAFLNAPPSLGRGNRGLMELNVEFQRREFTDLSATVWGTYASYEILGCASGYLSRLSGVLEMNIDYVGRSLGEVVQEEARTHIDRLFAVEMSGHAWDAKRFFHQVAGRDAPFWVKSWGGQLQVAAAGAGATSITVARGRDAADMIGRHVVVDGQYREITDAVDAGSQQTLTVAALTSAVAAGAPTSLLSLVRSDSDIIRTEYQHGFSSRVSIPVIEVHEPSEAYGGGSVGGGSPTSGGGGSPAPPTNQVTGSNITVVQANGAPSQETWAIIPGQVELRRGDRNLLYNVVVEASATGAPTISPQQTEWAVKPADFATADLNALSWATLNNAYPTGIGNLILTPAYTPMLMRATVSGRIFEVTFTAWEQGNGGDPGFRGFAGVAREVTVAI